MGKVGVVLGSGLGTFSEVLENRVETPYSQIPGWPPSTAAGHAGKLVEGRIGTTDVIVLGGRAHLYEGYSARQVTFGIRELHRRGVQSLVLTNSAGAINLKYRPGELVLISDHINLLGVNPLAGANDEALGPRFPDMSDAYARGLPHPQVGVAELVAYSELDGPGVTLKDVAKKLSSDRGLVAAQVLERAGAPALAAVEDAYGELDARGRNVGDNQVQALRRAGHGRRHVRAELDRATRAGRRELNDPKAVIEAKISVEPPTELPVKLLRALNIRDWDDDDLELQLDSRDACIDATDCVRVHSCLLS